MGKRLPTEKSERRIIYLERKEHGYCPRCGNKKRRPDNKYMYCVDFRGKNGYTDYYF